MNNLRLSFPALALCLLHACSANVAAPNSPAPSAVTERPDAAAADGPDDCTRGVIEADLQSLPLAGPGAPDGQLAEGQYVVSSTYLQMKPDKSARMRELMGPIMTDLAQRSGLVAIGLGTSEQCNTARTLSVWRDDAAMFEFVAGDAHGAAMRAVGELSRGGTVVTHWSGGEQTVSWSAAAERLAAYDGPSY